MKVIIILLIISSSVQAGMIWQQVDTGPCSGQVIVGDTGDDRPGYVIPPPIYNKEVKKDVDDGYEVTRAPDYSYEPDDDNPAGFGNKDN